MKKIAALLMIAVLTVSMSMTCFAAANKKQSILSEMQTAAEELGVQNSVTYQNAYNSVANYEGTITDEQYEAALAEIQAIKNAIASQGVDVVRNDETLKNELAAHVIAACEAVGITVVYEGNGIGEVVFTSDNGSGDEGTVSNPIKQTGGDYAPLFLMGGAIVAVFFGCVVFARKKQLFV